MRNAYSIGLHHADTKVAFRGDTLVSRRDLWRTLFVVDTFISLSLGRPTAINLDDCKGDDLEPPPPTTPPNSNFFDLQQISSDAIVAAVRSCVNIATVLKRVYRERKIGTKMAQEIADQCKQWPKMLPLMLHHSRANTQSPAQGVAILHVNLFYCHSLLLLTRPYFLFLLNDEIQRDIAHRTTGARPERHYLRMEKFGEACIICSAHTVHIIHSAYEAKYLPRRNPLVVYFLFAAALILLANEFASLYYHGDAQKCIPKAINLMSSCAEEDPQARRLLDILTTFRDDVLMRLKIRAEELHLSPHEYMRQQPPNSYAIISQADGGLGGTDANGTLVGLVDQQQPPPQQQQHQPMNSPAVDPALTQPQLKPVNLDGSTTDTRGALLPPMHLSISNTHNGDALKVLDMPNTSMGGTGSAGTAPEDWLEFDTYWYWPNASALATPTPGLAAEAAAQQLGQDVGPPLSQPHLVAGGVGAGVAGGMHMDTTMGQMNVPVMSVVGAGVGVE